MPVEWDEPASLRGPVLVAAFTGVFDAGEAASTSVEYLEDRLGATPIARIPAEPYFDFQQERPIVRFTELGGREVLWPDTVCRAAKLDMAHDLVLVRGSEPHLAWRGFVSDLCDVITGSGVQMVVTLGSTVAGFPHTRQPKVTGSTASPELARVLGIGRPSYQGMTGIVGVLQQRLEEIAVPAVSLRVPVPHYVSGPPNPPGTMALLRRLGQVTGIDTGADDFHLDVHEWRERVDSAVAEDPDVDAYVRQLEIQHDRVTDEEELPSGEDLAEEVERFLREEGDEPD